MSKAFTKDDGEDRDDDTAEPASPLPSGTKNYITPTGAERLKAELKDLLYVKRPDVVKVVTWAASNGDRSENADYIYGKRRLREIDRRIRFLTKRLEIAEIIDPATLKSDAVRFGATVTVEDDEGKRRTYQIVGIDETDGKRGRISWISPLGKALISRKVGDYVTFRTPGGDEEVEIVELRYEAILE